MNTQMTERFNVSGAMLVKLFGRHREEVDAFGGRASRVRDIGITGAMYGRVFFVALGLTSLNTFFDGTNFPSGGMRSETFRPTELQIFSTSQDIAR
jgi:hypothetical protein